MNKFSNASCCLSLSVEECALAMKDQQKSEAELSVDLSPRCCSVLRGDELDIFGDI